MATEPSRVRATRARHRPTPARAEALFVKYRAALESELGRDGLADDTIDAIGRREFGAAWGGAHPQDRVHIKPYHYYVINTDKHNKAGEHWMGVYTSANRAYIYDSYARPVEPLLATLVGNARRHDYKIGHTHLDYQGDQIGYSSSICGHDSLSWLLVVRDLGIRAAQAI